MTDAEDLEGGWPVADPPRKDVAPANADAGKMGLASGESAFLLNLISPLSRQDLLPLAELEADALLKAFLSGGVVTPRVTGFWLPPDHTERVASLIDAAFTHNFEEVSRDALDTVRDNPPHLLLVFLENGAPSPESVIRMAFGGLEARRPDVVALVREDTSPLLGAPPAWAQAVLPLSLPDPALRLHLQQCLRLSLARRDLEMIFLAHRVSREQLHRVTFTDPLTGLTNRAGFVEISARELGRITRTKETLGLIILDIDHFKKVNDTYGHPVGDSVLRELARILLREIRSLDHAIRFGGEEFGLLLPHTDLDELRLVADRLRQEVEAHHFEHMPGPGAVTISLGALCIHPARRPSMAEVYPVADGLLYRAKQEGRNRVVADRYA